MRRSYHLYHQRHFLSEEYEALKEESKEYEFELSDDLDLQIQSKRDLYYFHEHSLIHHHLYEFSNYKQIYNFFQVTKGAVNVILDYLEHYADWNEFTEKEAFEGLYHNDFIEGNHGFSSYLIKFASLISDEHIENKNIVTRSKLLYFWHYLKTNYSKTSGLIRDISCNINFLIKLKKLKD